MCGRFALAIPIEVIAELLRIGAFPLIPARYNIAPTQPVLAARSAGSGRAFEEFRWGLVPAWASDASGGARMINARAETLFDRRAYREPAATQRCVIPASGFYEWSTARKGRGRQPWFVSRADGQAMLFAGIFDRWQGPGGPLSTCSIVTSVSCASLRLIHDRMPVILEAAAVDDWLDDDRRERRDVEHLLRPADDRVLRMHLVSSLVNRVDHDAPACMAEAEPEPPVQPGLFD